MSKVFALVGGAVMSAALTLTFTPSFAADCVEPASCAIPGAEVDDEATIAARAKSGTGPASGIAADRRIETTVFQVGRLANGINVYSFRYLWDDRVRVGVLAQELLQRDDTKAAVLTMPNGLLGVDYAALGLRLATLEQWQASGLAALKADYKPSDAEAVAPGQRDLPVVLHNTAKPIRPAAGE